MALEDSLKELTTAINALITTTTTLVSLRTEAIESVKGAAAPVATTTKKDTKAAAAAETKAPEAAAAAAAAASTAIDPKVYEEMSASLATYIGAATRDEERNARKTKVKALLQHDAIKKPGTPDDAFDTANIKDESIQLFKDNIKMLIDQGDLTQPAASTALV